MTRDEALAIGRRVQVHPYEGLSLAERIGYELMKAYAAGVQDGGAQVIRVLMEAEGMEDEDARSAH